MPVKVYYSREKRHIQLIETYLYSYNDMLQELCELRGDILYASSYKISDEYIPFIETQHADNTAVKADKLARRTEVLEDRLKAIRRVYRRYEKHHPDMYRLLLRKYFKNENDLVIARSAMIGIKEFQNRCKGFCVAIAEELGWEV